MQKYFDLIKNKIRMGEVSLHSYQTSGIQPETDWLRVLGVSFGAIVLLAVWALLTYMSVSSPVTTSESSQNTPSLDKTSLVNMQAYYDTMSRNFSAWQNGSSTPTDPSL